MSTKAPKKIKKITHIQLTKKAGERFNFAAPYETELQKNRLLAPKLESSKKTSFVDIPDFLEFKTHSLNTPPIPTIEVDIQVLDQTPSKQLMEEAISITEVKPALGAKSQTKDTGAFAEYFEDENIFKSYKRRALFKSILFACFSTVLLGGLLTTMLWSNPFSLVILALLSWLYIQSFVTMCLLAIDRLVITLTILLHSVSTLFTIALIGMFGILPLVVTVLGMIVLTIASKEVERLQIVSRIMDYTRVVKVARVLILTFLVSTIFVVSAHIARASDTKLRFAELIPKSLIQQQLTNDQPLSGVITTFTDTKSYSDFLGTKAKTVKDVILEYSYQGTITALVKPEEYPGLGILTFDTEEVKQSKLEPLQNERLLASQFVEYQVTLPLDTLVTKEIYSTMVVNRAYQQISDKGILLPISSPVTLISLTLGSALYGIAVSMGFLAIMIVFYFLSAILSLLGISFERIWWWIIKKTKIITIATEKIESEVIVL